MSQTREPPHPRRIFRQKKDHLPHDIVLNILANLPAKSVLRFSTIPSFIGGYDSTFNRISEYPIPSGFPSSCYDTADSCNGLVCFTDHEYLPTSTGDIYLWNPSIRKLQRLPGFSPTQYHWVSTGFAYQSNTNDYKVVKFSQMTRPDNSGIEAEAEVYTLSSNSWRRVGISLANNFIGLPVDSGTSTFVSGALHWLGNVFGAASRSMILSFDVNNDKFGERALPHVQQQQLLPQGVMAIPNCLMVFKGKLGFITLGYLLLDHINNDVYRDYIGSHANSCFIWVMGEYGVHESWSKLIFVQFENVASVRFFGCTSRGELLVIKKLNPESNTERRRFMVVSLDLETSLEKDLGFQKVPYIATTFMESLVLLDGATELSG
ncbi:hypothetical protein ACB092_07G182100 [Castanea dentata]